MFHLLQKRSYMLQSSVLCKFFSTKWWPALKHIVIALSTKLFDANFACFVFSEPTFSRQGKCTKQFNAQLNCSQVAFHPDTEHTKPILSQIRARQACDGRWLHHGLLKHSLHNDITLGSLTVPGRWCDESLFCQWLYLSDQGWGLGVVTRQAWDPVCHHGTLHAWTTYFHGGARRGWPCNQRRWQWGSATYQGDYSVARASVRTRGWRRHQVHWFWWRVWGRYYSDEGLMCGMPIQLGHPQEWNREYA